MKRNLMRRAHQIAKGLKGDYRARMSIALRQAWKEEKGVENGIKKLSWTGKNGNQIELRATCKTEMVDNIIDLDGLQIKSGKKASTSAMLELWADGKKVDSCWNTAFWKMIGIDNGLEKVWGLKLAMDAERAKEVQKFLDDVIENGKTAEVKEAEAKKAAEETAKEIATAKSIIEKANGQSEIMTNAEYARWRRNYNNINNEGGEGYIPKLVTAEELQYAKEILAKAQA